MPQRRRPRPGAVVLVVLAVLAVVELWLLVEVARGIGVGWVVLAVALQAVVGAAVIRREGSRAWRAVRSTVERGRAPEGEFSDASLVMGGGLLLMLPGFLSDLPALFLIVGATRPVARRVLERATARRLARSGVDVAVVRASRPFDATTVEGEVVPDAPPGSASSSRSDGPQDPPAISGTVI